MKIKVYVECEIKGCRKKATHKWINDRDNFYYVCNVHGEILEKMSDDGELYSIKEPQPSVAKTHANC